MSKNQIKGLKFGCFYKNEILLYFKKNKVVFGIPIGIELPYTNYCKITFKSLKEVPEIEMKLLKKEVKNYLKNYNLKDLKK